MYTRDRLKIFITRWMNIKELCVLNFAARAHLGQKRKYTGEPYIYHSINVADIASSWIDNKYTITICLLHDVVEDTEISMMDVYRFLHLEARYKKHEARYICKCVWGLTEKYTSENYPDLRRASRKIKEAIRLGWQDSLTQSCKIADLIDNTRNIVEFDRKFAEVYLEEKAYILSKMTKSNEVMRAFARDEVSEMRKTFNK